MIQKLDSKSIRWIASVPSVSIKSIPPVCMAFFLLSTIACNQCGTIVKGQGVSPDGQLVARVSERDCGATTDFSSVVNLQRPSDKFDPNNGVLFVAESQHAISMRWLTEKELLVTCASCSRKDVFRELTVTGDIEIRYGAN